MSEGTAMRLIRRQFALSRMMLGIAACGILIAVWRWDYKATTVVLILIVPLIGSLLDITRRKGNGLRGAAIGGAVVYGAFGIGSLISLAVLAGRSNKPIDLEFPVLLLALQVPVGAVIGLLEGAVFWLMRDLARLPRILRERSERSARANSHRPATSPTPTTTLRSRSGQSTRES